MDKKQRNKAKKRLKQDISRLIGDRVSCGATFSEEKQTWKIGLSVDFDIPEELSQVKEGINEDSEQAKVIAFMKEQEGRIVSLLKETFQAEYTPEKEGDFNFTIPIPPMFSTKCENGVSRLKTQEEREQEKIKFPSLKGLIESDERLLASGHFEFRGEEGIPEYDGFVLVKYAGLRARYLFIIPHEKVAV